MRSQAIGFGFLYTLLRRYAWSGVAFNFLLAALVLQWAVLCGGFWENVRGRVQQGRPHAWFPSIPVSLESMIFGDYTAATILISFGAVLGRVSPTQLVLMAFFETIVAAGNVSIANHLKVNDAGGSMVIHVFGASFGLAFAYFFGDAALCGAGNGEAQLGTTRNNGTFAMIGTLFLFCFWPSFNAALLTGAAAERAVVNTLLAICASVVAAFALSRALHCGSKLDMEHVQNATLAGGVVIGAACEQITNLGGAVGLGAVAGIVSTLGFTCLGPRLKRAGLTDTCGIASLHWMPGMIGGFASAVAAASQAASASRWTTAAAVAEFSGRAAGRSPVTQGGYQAAVTVISLGIGAASGALAGAVLRGASWAEPMTNSFYEDAGAWNVPLEGEELPELESDIASALAAERAELVDALLTVVGEALGKELPRPSPAALSALLAARRGAAAAEGSVRSANKRWTEGSSHGGTANREWMQRQAAPGSPVSPVESA